MINVNAIIESDKQEKLDWERFSACFEKLEGFKPHPNDSHAKQLFRYFTAGAHEEFLGRLNIKDKNGQ